MVWVLGMLGGVQRLGIAPDPFLQDAGIDPALLAVPEARVTGEQYIALFRSLMDRRDDEGLGFFSRRLKRGCLELIGRSALGAATLEAGMVRAARTFRLLQDDVELVPVRDGELAGWAFHFTDAQVQHPEFMHGLLLRIYWRLLAWLAGGRLPAARFELAFGRPPHVEAYGNVLRGELRFDQPHSAFWFAASALDEPVRQDEAGIRRFVEDVPHSIILPRQRDDDVGMRVRMVLQNAVPAWPDLATTAQALHMSPSTLQRHLAGEGTTFQALKDELRRDLSIQRLNTSAVPLAVLAGELGFADSAAFQRAFKSWTGSPPGAYRRGVA